MEAGICWNVCVETLSAADLTLLYPSLQKMAAFGRITQQNYLPLQLRKNVRREPETIATLAAMNLLL